MAKKTNCTKNGKKYYRVVRVIGHKSDGSPIKKEFYAEGKAEAEEKANKYINKLKDGLEIGFEKLTLVDGMSNWIYNVKKYDNIKPSTFESYEGTFRNYVKNSDIAYLLIFEIKSIHLQTHYNKMSKNGFSSSKIKKLNKLLYQFFEYEINEGHLKVNPARHVNVPRLKEEIIKNEEDDDEEIIEFFTEAQIDLIKNAIKGSDIELLVLFALSTGLRQGELLALRYSDIDFSKNILKVNRTVKVVYTFDNNNKKNREVLFLEPKTKRSKRIVPIPLNIIKLIDKKDTKELVFTDKGNVWEARKVYRHWISILKENNIEQKKFHALRHTYATILLIKGVDLVVVSRLLGHSSVKITEKYLHVIPSLKIDATSKINDIF